MNALPPPPGRLLVFFASVVFFGTAAPWLSTHYGQDPAASNLNVPPKVDPLSAEESLKRIHVPPGYRVELVASEPLIEEPVMCTWDANGRMYVAEMRSYMQDTEGTGRNERNGRVKRLEDTDGDGRMDRASVFADGLLLPRIIMPLDDRIIIRETHNPDFVSYRDTDGDGCADEQIPLGKGMHANGSVEHEDSALTWTLDNWMYTAKGGWRHRFTRGVWESEKCESQTDNQWGMGMDDIGTLFFSHNSFPGRGFQQPWNAWSLLAHKSGGRYTRPKLAPHDTTDEFHQIYPVHSVGDRQNNPDKAFTSACGISIYRGDAMPDLRGDMFICEPCGHIVRRAKVDIHEGKRTLRNAQEKAEFFASEDFYCRPVWTATGPDGCLYIVDMYRGIIQDKPWVDSAFAKRIQSMGADQVKRRGRIWRVVPDGFKRPAPKRLLSATSGQLVEHLADANGFTRDMAQRLLVLRHDRSMVAPLLRMGREHAEPLARLHALWTLEGLDALESSPAVSALQDADSRIRAAAVRLCEPWIKQGDAAVHQRVVEAARDPDPEVLRQVILTLGWCTLPEATQAIESIIAAHLDNEIIYLAAMTALWGQRSSLVEKIFAGTVFQTIADPVRREQARQRWKSGILAWAGMKVAPRVLDAEAIALVDRGAARYAEICAACHGPDGKGLQPPGSLPLAPALDGSERLRGQKERLVRIVLHGLKGTLDGKQYAGDAMPALGALDDETLASVLTYARQTWSNDEEPIRAADVAAVRRASQARTEPWSPAEVDRFEAPLVAHSRKTTEKGQPFPFTAYRGFSNNKTLGRMLEPDPKKRGPWIHGPNTPGHWFAVDLQVPMEITSVLLETQNARMFPRGWEMRVSNDGEIWSEPVAAGRGSGRHTRISFEPVVTRFFKIVQTGNAAAGEGDGKPADLWQVFDFGVHGRQIEDSLEKLLDARPARAPQPAEGNFPGGKTEPAVSGKAPIRSEASPQRPAADVVPKKPERLRALILDGQNNHDFRGTTEGIRATLASTGRFGDWSQVKFSRSPVWWEQPEPKKPASDAPAAVAQYTEDVSAFSEARQAYYKQSALSQKIWRPPFPDSDVVIVNYNGSLWPEHVQQAFEEFIRNGGGAVIVHAANNCFENWPAYNTMLGIGWRGPRFGRWIAVDDSTGQPVVVPEEKPASSSHGDFVPFLVKTRAPQHPIMQGVPDEWMHGADELYVRMRGSAENLTVLASAFSPGAKQHEPVVWCTSYGKGRVVTTSMGHYQRPAHYTSLNCVGFQTVLARSCEWAATGTVTIPVPQEFPGREVPSIAGPKGIHWRPR